VQEEQKKNHLSERLLYTGQTDSRRRKC